MTSVMLQMAALIACGIVWARLRPGGLDADQTRKVLTTLVYYLLVPALVLRVLWIAPLGVVSLQIAALAALGIGFALALTWVLCRVCRLERAALGATLLVSAWPNAIYLGLPILELLYGDPGRAVAIQFDLFSALPLLLTVGILIARHYGAPDAVPQSMLRGLLSVPSLWAAFLGIGLNLAGVPQPTGIEDLLALLSHGVAPLMLFALGLALVFDRFRLRDLRPLLTVSVVQLVAAPAFALGIVMSFGMTGLPALGSILELAMPAAVLGLVICDRYRLDTALYAAAVTLTTVLSLLTLPVWFYILRTLIAV